jgi:hypothetical protein
MQLREDDELPGSYAPEQTFTTLSRSRLRGDEWRCPRSRLLTCNKRLQYAAHPPGPMRGPSAKADHCFPTHLFT